MWSPSPFGGQIIEGLGDPNPFLPCVVSTIVYSKKSPWQYRNLQKLSTPVARLLDAKSCIQKSSTPVQKSSTPAPPLATDTCRALIRPTVSSGGGPVSNFMRDACAGPNHPYRSRLQTRCPNRNPNMRTPGIPSKSLAIPSKSQATTLVQKSSTSVS